MANYYNYMKICYLQIFYIHIQQNDDYYRQNLLLIQFWFCHLDLHKFATN